MNYSDGIVDEAGTVYIFDLDLLWHYCSATCFVAAISPFQSNDCSIGVALFGLYVMSSAHRLEADEKLFT